MHVQFVTHSCVPWLICVYQLLEQHAITLRRRHRDHIAAKTQRPHCSEDTETTLQRRHRDHTAAKTQRSCNGSDTTISEHTATQTQRSQCNEDTGTLFQLIQQHLIRLQQSPRDHTATKTQMHCFSWYNNIWFDCKKDIDTTQQRKYRYVVWADTTTSDETTTKTRIAHCNEGNPHIWAQRERYLL